MNQGPHLQLLERIKKPPSESVLVSALWRVGAIVVFPLVLILGLGVMAVLGLTTALSRVLNTRSGPPDPSGQLDRESDLNPWQPILESEDFVLYRKNIGEIRFGPGYFALRSVPEIEALNDQTFGEWTHRVEVGVLLQRWTSTTNPDTDLLLLDTKARTLRTIAKNIPSVQWRVESSSGEILLVCDTGKETLKYSLTV
jgi:hypothetical protein